MTLRYVCSLPIGEGSPRHCFHSDAEAGHARAELFAQQENRPGRGVYDCIGVLKDGVSARNKENVAELGKVVADLDLKNIVEPREKVIATLQGLLLQPSELRDSGFGLHAEWKFKEAANDDAGLEQAERIMKRLAVLLAADPMPTHRAALLRRPGTDNFKGDEPRKCHAIEHTGKQYDISEFEDMFDLYGEQSLLTRKEEPRVDGHAQDVRDGERLPVDLETELAALAPGNVNEIQCRVIPSLIWRGMHPEAIIDRVVTATMAMAKANGLTSWTERYEAECVIRRIKSAYKNLFLKDYDHVSGEIPAWLPDEWRQAWAEALAAGRKPNIGSSGNGFFVRSYDPEERSQSMREAKARARNGDDVVASPPLVPAAAPASLWKRKPH